MSSTLIDVHTIYLTTYIPYTDRIQCHGSRIYWLGTRKYFIYICFVQAAFDDAIAELDTLSEESYKGGIKTEIF